MKLIDRIISFPLSVLLHVLGVLIVCSQAKREAMADNTAAPEIEVTSLESMARPTLIFRLRDS